MAAHRMQAERVLLPFDRRSKRLGLNLDRLRPRAGEVISHGIGQYWGKVLSRPTLRVVQALEQRYAVNVVVMEMCDQDHIDAYYEPFEQIKAEGLDALIITGANVTHPDLSQEAFWEPLIEVVDWASKNVTSILCSCLATHAVMQFHHGQARTARGEGKLWGVFEHSVMDRSHPLVNDVNTQFDVPHSRFNQISRGQFDAAGVRVLVESEEAGVHLAVSKDGLRVVYFQGHPEYDTISLLKEYKREVMSYAAGRRKDYPPFPENYFSLREQAIFNEYRDRLEAAQSEKSELPEFPEYLIDSTLHNTWHDTAEAVIGNWIGLVYQVTNKDRRIPFMEGVDPDNPLALT